MLDKLGINPVNLVAQIINFGILLFVLTKFLYKPILRLFEERAKKISQGLKAAEESIKEREGLEESKRQEMKKTREDMEKLLAQARVEAKSTSQEIINQAREEAKKEAEKEYQQLQQRLHQEEKVLKTRVAKMTVALTKKILEKSLDKATQKKIFAGQLKKLKSLAVK